VAENEDKLPTALTQQDEAQARDEKADASGAAQASVELSEDDLDAVPGGTGVTPPDDYDYGLDK
jgi:hypothetical protein